MINKRVKLYHLQLAHHHLWFTFTLMPWLTRIHWMQPKKFLQGLSQEVKKVKCFLRLLEPEVWNELERNCLIKPNLDFLLMTF